MTHRTWMFQIALAVLLALCASTTLATGFNGYRGMWYDRAHPGHGVDVQQFGDSYFAVFFTYDAQGEPEWFAAQGSIANGVFDTDLVRASYDYAAHTQRVAAVVGRMHLSYDAQATDPACSAIDRSAASELAILQTSIDGQALTWCLEPLIQAQVLPATAMSGTWWGGFDDSGWGLTSYFIPRETSVQSVHVIYHYDANSAPRWSIAEANDADFALEADWLSVRGYCRSCTPVATLNRPAGELNLHLVSPLRLAGLANRMQQTLVYPGPAGGRWDRDIDLQRLSDAHFYGGTVATREGLVAPDIFLDDSNHRAYLGIPYAAPPTGDLRWRAPQAALPRSQVLSALARTPGCPQDLSQSYFGAAPASTGEDCLTLNVWVASRASSSPRPVMVWIHGGGLVQGGALQEAPVSRLLSYDGTNFTTRDALYVSINYRLGPLGFLAVREFDGEHADHPSAGNYGFLDQVAALKWVRDNAAAFGGDPNNVTIFGESAGGVSVCAHLASPLSRGLFRRAIMQSGNCRRNMPRLANNNGNLPPAFEQGDRIKQRLACVGSANTIAACLRAKSVADIISAGQATVGFGRPGESYEMVIDDYAFDRSVGPALADGSAAAVPLIIGVNQDEANTLLANSQKPQSVAEYEALVRSTMPTIADQVLLRYTAANYTPVWKAWAAIVSDVGFICPARRAARDHAAQGRPVYAYYFTQNLPGEVAPLGAFHGIEIPFLFNLLLLDGAELNALADRMRDAWSAFARNGVPAANGMPVWPQHPATGSLGLELNGSGDRIVSGYRSAYCDFWAQYIAL